MAAEDTPLSPALAHLQSIREYELDVAASWFPAGARVLEIGAGAGWQARRLSEQGFEVEAVDLAVSNYRQVQVFPVTVYDGHHLPFPEGHFDVVYSSSVLEHVPHLDALLVEMKRVLKPGGMAVHVVPSACWRFWTLAAHYPFVVKAAWGMLRGRGAPTSPGAAAGAGGTAKPRWREALWPERHGERGTAISELYEFSRLAWGTRFRRGGWRIQTRSTTRVFYTGYAVVGGGWSLERRRGLRHVLGSACHVYVIVPRRG